MAAARDSSTTPRFGDLLRGHRLAAGLSQEALAERADLSARAISDLERGVKLRPHPETLRRLADALSLGPAERAALVAARPAGRSAATTPWRTLPTPLTPLVGRKRQVAAICALLHRDDVRLLTLTGPGGVGKTRLALEAAAALEKGFADGVWFVDLAPLTDSALVPVAVADALGVRETGARPLVEALSASLSEKRLLLVLDNFEHLPEAAPFVVQLLSTGANLKILVTSRARLRVRGERELPVPPLDLPDRASAGSAERLSQYEAVRLFLQRAVEVKPDFAITNETAPAVAEICHRLDGLPLAIELAAARIKLLPPEALLRRLEQRLAVLTDGARDLPLRHRTLRNAIAWSFDLLTVDEQALFRRLAVFAGGCTLEAAEAIGDPDGTIDVFGSLAALVDGSLLREGVGPGPKGFSEPRFGMLETIREFALERLQANGEEAASRHRHATWCLAFAERVNGALWGSVPGQALDQLEAEQGNLRAALAWALDSGEIEFGLRLGAALWDFQIFRGQLSEARKWQENLLVRATDLPPSVHAMALSMAGELAQLAGDHEEAMAQQEESLTLARRARDPQVLGRALYQGALMADRCGDRDRQVTLAEQALEVFRDLGEAHWMVEVLLCLGRGMRQASETGEARALLEEALALAENRSDAWGTAWATAELAELATGKGDVQRAATLLREAVRRHGDHADHLGIDLSLLRIAKLAGAVGQPEAAVRLLGAAAALRERRGAVLTLADSRWHEDYLAELRHRMGPEAFAAASAAGRDLTLEEGIAEAVATAERLAAANAPAPE